MHLAFLVALVIQEPPPTPTLTEIQPAGDTIWFATAARHTPAAVFAFDRRSGRWAPGGQRAVDGVVNRIPRLSSDTVVVDRDHALVVLETEDRRVFGVQSRHQGRALRLTADMPFAERKRFAASHFVQEPADSARIASLDVATEIGAWAREDDVLWVGLAGLFSEGTEALGGLLQVDLKRDTVIGLWDVRLGNAKVTGVAVVRDAVWLGTVREGEYGPYPAAGLVRYDPRRNEWSQLDSTNSPLPGSLVWSVTGDGDYVWLTTNAGVARFEPQPGRWLVWRFQPVAAGDRVAWDLVEGSPDPARFALLWLADAVRTERPGAFLAAGLRVPRELLNLLVAGNADAKSAVLIHPALTPFLMKAMVHPVGRSTAAPAVERLRRGPADPVRSALLSRELNALPRAEAAKIARDLATLGDSGVKPWLRDALAGEGRDTAGAWFKDVLGGVAVLRDTVAGRALLPLLGSPNGRDVLTAIAGIDDIGLWRQAAREIIRIPALWAALIASADDSRARQLDPIFQGTATAVARRGITLADRAARFEAALFLVQHRDTTGMRPLIELLSDNRDTYTRGMMALLVATGDDAVPVGPSASPGDRARARLFWERWWDDHRAAFRFAPEDRGQRALQRWQTRGH